MLRAFLVALSLVFMLAIALNVLLGIGGNFGLSFGYYGKMNWVEQRLDSTPNIELLKLGELGDATLKDLWAVIEVCGDTIEIEFQDADVRSRSELARDIATAIPYVDADCGRPKK